MSSKMHRSCRAKLARTFRAPSSITNDAVHNFFSALDCPRSLALWLMYSNNEFSQLLELDCNPSDYNSMVDFRDSYAATCFLSKANFLPVDVKRDVAAFDKFFKFEDLCRSTNRRFKALELDPLFKGSNVWLLNATIQKISRILGDFCPEEWFEQANWGPGVTTMINGCHVSSVNKFQSESGITRSLYSLVKPLFSVAYPQWDDHLTAHAERDFSICAGNKIVTVPKNSKIDRVIAIEPGINLWFQKGIGTMIRRRLSRVGVNLNDQGYNQRLARWSSKKDHLATVDFSSASDSISYQVVKALLPPTWFQVMDSSRSPLGLHNDTPIFWEKFSSMGNGFTFELESLIFFAAAQSVSEYLRKWGPINVYGDDVILPSDCYALFREFCTFLGFKVNMEKTFSYGHFRESCGVHYYDGVNCSPIFLKEPLKNVLSIFKLANSIRAYSHRRNNYNGCDDRFRHCWRHLFLRVPSSLRFRIPLGAGDGGFVSCFDESTPSLRRADSGIEGFLTDALIESGVTSDHFEETGLLLSRLKTRSVDQAYMNTYTLRGRTRLAVKPILVRQWYYIGPWI